ncbi:unnamed protein product [Brassicogethes aeneus]|uniref:PID domain-containing protein n=1 Tax=Brassicogethes aeneus TaxID=1431903 RepID=A0A9P0BJ43_BRAAE|nr:unnamed protein product [Brassicogethes aeneus]
MSFLKSIWKANSKHKKLSEELALQNAKETESLQSDQIDISEENDLVTFKLKYLGSTVVEKITGDSISTEAVKNIIKTSKAGRKKLQRVNVNISIKGISVCDLQGNDILKVSIYRISNCSTDPTHKQIFSFVSTDTNETMECHAFVCSKRKIAETVTLAVAQAFGTAYEAWRLLPSTQDVQKNAANVLKNEPESSNKNIEDFTNQSSQSSQRQRYESVQSEASTATVTEEVLIDFESDVKAQNEFQMFSNPWVVFEDDFANEPPKNFNRSGFIIA